MVVVLMTIDKQTDVTADQTEKKRRVQIITKIN